MNLKSIPSHILLEKMRRGPNICHICLANIETKFKLDFRVTFNMKNPKPTTTYQKLSNVVAEYVELSVV